MKFLIAFLLTAVACQSISDQPIDSVFSPDYDVNTRSLLVGTWESKDQIV